MKKLLMILIMLGIALGLTGVTFAEESSYTICASINNPTCINSNITDIGDYTVGVSDTFDQTGIYTFSILDGSWQTDQFANPSYEWSLYIWQTGTGDHLLGSHTLYGPTNVLSANKALPSRAIDINVTADETLWFYLKETDTSPNWGNVTVAVTAPIVPEPISSVLFLTGGVMMVGRKYMKKRRA